MDSKGICFANAMRILGLHCLCLLFTDSTVIGATHVVILPSIYCDMCCELLLLYSQQINDDIDDTAQTDRVFA